MKDLSEVFGRLKTAGLKINPKKCAFAQSSCTFLGHVISKNGISPPGDKLQAIEALPVPKNANELRRVLGLFNWFRKFIPNYSAVEQTIEKQCQVYMDRGSTVSLSATQEHAYG